MQKLFIDANIYLGFYNSNKPEFKKLLAALNELSERIFITYQIIDEVNRNKLNVFSVSIQNYLKQSKITITRLPEHLNDESTNRINEWNDKRKVLEEKSKKIYTELEEILTTIVGEVEKSEDRISKELEKVFRNPLQAKEFEFKSARVRKETGNPPGKLNDPLGDQLNWVQVLGSVKDVTKLYIVSNDYDYFTEHDNKLFLNPLLYKELITINPSIVVSVYNKLSEALKDFNNHEPIKSLPSEKEMSIILIDEPELHLNPEWLKKMKFYGGGHARPITCKSCGTKDNYDDGTYLPSQNGGLTYQFTCNSCGYRYDTGDFWN